VCCGALDQHAGRAESAQQLARQNCRAFGTDDTAVLSTATSCTATLLDYGRLAEQDGAALRTRVRDITDFLLEAWDPETHAPTAIRASVAVHLPCTARHVTGSAEATETLLARVPGLDLHRLDPGYGCCGAAGHHFLSRGSQADALLRPLLRQIDGLKPDFVVTTNIGCALHLAGGLAGGDKPPRVVHAAELVALALGVTD
ncbi:MAG: (Fe-S)-binding protein, partial [Gammaproteobacteria bacterium]